MCWCLRYKGIGAVSEVVSGDVSSAIRLELKSPFDDG